MASSVRTLSLPDPKNGSVYTVTLICDLPYRLVKLTGVAHDAEEAILKAKERAKAKLSIEEAAPASSIFLRVQSVVCDGVLEF